MKYNRPNKIKVLFRLRSLEMGGVQKVLLDILEHLPKEHLDISLMVNFYQGELRDQIPDDIKLIKLAKGKEDYSRNSFLQNLQRGMRAIKMKILDVFPFLLDKIYYREKYDVEVAFGRSELSMVLKSPQKKSKKIAWVHWEFSHDPEINKSEWVVSQLRKFDHVVFCSDNVRKQVNSMYAVDFPNYSVFYNVIHPEEVTAKSEEKFEDISQLNEDCFTFSSVGRVKNGKGYPLLLDIHKKLIDKGFKHRIIIVGDGDRLEELRKKAQSLGLQDSFILLGNRNNPFPYLKQSDAFILPTKSEAYPLSVKEALILGLPVLVTDVGGVNEIISDGIDGLLMKYDEADITQKMESIITDKELYSKLKKGASAGAEKFEIEGVYKKIENLFLTTNGK